MKTILVAEDTDSNYLLLSIILRKKYNLIRALNGAEAVALWREHKPDLVLMDMKMPIMDGMEATREIRKEDTVTPIVALTANAFDSDRQRSAEAGCNDYMSKPITSGDLTAMVKKFLGE